MPFLFALRLCVLLTVITAESFLFAISPTMQSLHSSNHQPVGLQMGPGHSWQFLCTCSGGTSWGKQVQKNCQKCPVPICNPAQLTHTPFTQHPLLVKLSLNFAPTLLLQHGLSLKAPSLFRTVFFSEIGAHSVQPSSSIYVHNDCTGEGQCSSCSSCSSGGSSSINGGCTESS